jgi:bisphosphoglycerate-dependent phosphoglycerate mutase
LPFDTAKQLSLKPSRAPDLQAALAGLPRARKHYQWYYSTRPANADMVGAPQGLHAFLRAYYHVKSADWPENRPYRLAGWTAEEQALARQVFDLALRRQVEALSRRLARQPIAAFYASPLDRTMETARILAAPHAMEVQARDGLKEISHGHWEQMTRKEVEAAYPDEAAAWDRDPYTYAPPEGESGLAVTARALPAHCRPGLNMLWVCRRALRAPCPHLASAIHLFANDWPTPCPPETLSLKEEFNDINKYYTYTIL